MKKNIAFIQIDESAVEPITHSKIYADSITMITQRYPSAGKNNVLIRFLI
jgi:dipeptidyl-peptidase-4